MNALSLFSGIGGLDLGLQRAGISIVGQVERDPWRRRVLAKHWPEVPQHDDVATALDWWTARPRPAVDLVAGGFPCQPSSQAGRRLGEADRRWRWPDMLTVIRALRPTWAVGENVPGLRTRGLATVLADLTTAGYAVRAGEISACAMGAPHTRTRLFVLAHTAGLRRCPWRHDRTGDGPAAVELPDGTEARRDHWWATQSRVGRVAYGVPGRLDRLAGLGDAVVPQVAEHIGRLITGAAA